MTRIPRPDQETYAAREARLVRAQRAAHELLCGLEAQPAADCDERDIHLMDSLDALFAQTVRATRHTSGSVRAYASLIEDGYDNNSNASMWAARISRSVGDLDEFASRVAALRMCESERVTTMRWADVLARVTARCGSLGACTIEVVDRTAGNFQHRPEWLGRALFHALRNAVEATPRGGIVRVRADQIRIEGASAVHIRTTDPGTGIDAAIDLRSIWKPFISAKASHAGLGLAYVAACARRLGMTNGVRSDATGTTFHSIIFEEGELTW